MAATICLGPVLGFRGVEENRWYTSALVVYRNAPAVPTLSVTPSPGQTFSATPVLLKSHLDYQVWRFDWNILQTDQDQVIAYFLPEKEPVSYLVPARQTPLRLGYGSCFSVHTLQDVNKVKNRHTMWKVLQRLHRKKPYHLFFLGGDQVYSDQVWEVVPELREWLQLPLKKRLEAPFTPAMEAGVTNFYFNLYLQTWNQKHPAALLGQIPTLMMWDDHDIFDGWGSYAAELQVCPVFKGIFAQARAHFQVFQLQAGSPLDLGKAASLGKDGFTYAHGLPGLALVAFDLRSERTQNQVMSPETWNQIQDWMQNIGTEITTPETPTARNSKHLLVMSGIPIVNADLTLLETALDMRPGQQRMEDDLKDQWLSRAHQQERLRLVHRLFRFSQETGCRVTLVSGDAHVAFQGYIQSERNPEAAVINQLTSSAMVNLPPPALVVYMMERLLAGKVETVDRGITARLVKFPGTSRRILGRRNFLSLTLDAEPCIWAEWYVEGEKKPFTKVIHPVNTSKNK